MFEALVITLREGVEAALVLAIAVSVLRRRGLAHLAGALYAGAALAVGLSAVAAVAATRLTWNQDLVEGVAMLIGSALVISLVYWMWKSAPRMKEEIESGIARAAESGGSTAGLFLFSFGMVFREGLETAVFLAAAGFNSAGLGRWIGAGAGLALAIGFGVLFVRGSLRVPLKPFFSLTSAVLLLIAIQLLVGGLHELSEMQLLPASRAEMALVGPLVKNELLLFTLTVALAAVWLLFAPAVRPAPGAPAAPESGPEARLALAARRRERARRRGTGVVGLVVVGFLATAFVQRSRLPGKAPAAPAPLVGGVAALDTAGLGDGRMHFFETTVDTTRVRYFALRAGGALHVCYDACTICGAKGYFQDGRNLVCRNCLSPIEPTSLGHSGGCNPIPLPFAADGGRLVVRESDLRAGLPRLKGR